MSAKKRPLEPLDLMPFMTSGEDGRRIFWRSHPAPDDYSVACALGHGLFATMKDARKIDNTRPEVLLQFVLTDMVRAGRVSGVEIGFLTALADDWAKS